MLSKIEKYVIMFALSWTCIIVSQAYGLTSLMPLAEGNMAYMCQLDDGNTIVLFWIQDWKLFYRISTDHGQTWSQEVRLTSGAAHWDPTALQDSSSRLWLLWTSNRNSTDNGYDLEYMTSVDYGLTWATHGRIVTPDYTSQRGSLIETDDEILVFWGFGRWVTTADAGQTWSGITELVDNALYNQMLYRAYDNQLWIVGWTGKDIWAKKSNDSVTWSDPIKITNNGSARSPAVSPEIGQDRYGNFIVTWNSQHLDPNNNDLWYAVSFDNGQTWEPAQRLTQDKGQDTAPSLALIDGSLWAVWNSDRVGYNLIYSFELGPNPWDFNSDGCVDLADYVVFSQQWSQSCGPGETCTRADFDKNGRIDLSDLDIFANHWLKKTPSVVPDEWPKPGR